MDLDSECDEPKTMYMKDGTLRYICPRCGVKYKKITAVRGHMRECGLGAQCPFCPKIVTQRRNLPKHIERHQKNVSNFPSLKILSVETLSNEMK
ncbi:uncharacterized zinc finger protein CG2678-like [Condylostylus longicornis]|uniref:uncharacterized zinc finger protein CG2678-like n=1 Tax=Condylostylus longicornis TaxID=2530218 RepID=UPI00244DD639|nr:uncharacterized zinc finger protein CG2678-like [Condylostylus longicornis]